MPQPRPHEPSTPTAIDPQRYAAIHRALLSGLLGNLGHKTTGFDYLGARGRKFHLFPGSGQFSRKPPWVMSAELTETTRLYARTVAKIEPEWVEQVAQHLLHREYNEPYYHRASAHVLASEKVSLFGMVIVPSRRVHYGPIEPKISREIFIRQGLVEGEYNSNAPWERNNRQLIRDIELTEAKLRRHDTLVDSNSRFAFFDAKIPAGIYDGPLFEKWRRQAEGRDRRVLFMRREDLILPGIEAPADQFPERVVVNEHARLQLQYFFEPGHPADGVTAVIPLALLNQVPAEPFEWLVPGHLLDKVTELIRTLPKDLRVPFVPIPETARAILPSLKFGEGSLLEQLAWQLGKTAGDPFPAVAFSPDHLPEWLRMNFAVVDERGKTVETGRDLELIRRKLRVELRSTFENLPAGEWHRDGVTRWDFSDLPAVVEVRRPGLTVRGYPAVVDRGESVSLRLLETPERAAEATRAGLRRLFLLQIGEQAKSLQRHLPDIDAICLNYATIGSCDELKREIMTLAADRALFGDDTLPLRSRDEFISRAEQAWQRLSESAREICRVAAETLMLYQSLARRLGQPAPPLMAANLAEERQHLAGLLPRGFVASTPFAWLKHLPRFLRAADSRLKKLNSAVARDTQMMEQLKPLWKRYTDRVELHRFQGIVDDPPLRQYRWAMEELRVSLFAQELKTSIPVSVKRLDQLWADVR